jgi:hypothetical protein
MIWMMGRTFSGAERTIMGKKRGKESKSKKYLE